MESKLVTLKIDNGIAYVTLNRPEKYNALNIELFQAIDKTIKKLHKNTAVRAVILSGAGGNFSSGLDVKSVSKSMMPALKLLFKWLPGNANLAQRVSLGWQQLPIPVICVIEGFCYGGGVQIALGADFRFASKDAQLSIMESKWGLLPDMAGLAGLRQIMTKDKAMQLTYTADIITADKALEFGLVTEVHDKPLEMATRYAEKLMQRSPDTNAAIKLSINKNWSGTLRSLLSRESLSQIRLLLGKNRLIASHREIKQSGKPYQDRQSGW
ncbi:MULTISPECIES: crotonase/enoyl-CoA hydratase family protein [Shewanella]|uniref:Enoyl-CoA hydratase n=1 Tax=Shewanella japonica TaxID=93973 RepID=A0ABM6JG32_9GAMM|nr:MULTISPECIES: crotonase/enoyl-CoA hydratase family protein [Shewanella]ARD21004.1 enoyl-CoA hydratase [Shewanella japonica]MBQ4890612.1 crotonase/enoyl-CoA hydratase family protein [Shewanella sp. MMG014]OBT06887.1 enoyl-CoA hydratase [Shewanella sp. UCD-FRSSP16_17]